MPLYLATFSSCDCTPVPDMVFRADDIVSAVIECQDKIEMIRRKAKEAKVELHSDITLVGLNEGDNMEFMDELGIDSLVDFWKEVVEK